MLPLSQRGKVGEKLHKVVTEGDFIIKKGGYETRPF
jgi:hypothetical protein